MILHSNNTTSILAFVLLLAACFSNTAQATVLPEERADVMYHEYDGDGIKIAGPSVLVRKNFLDKVSISGNYYVDNVTSASIDVRSYGSPYEEERTEQSFGVDVLNEKTITSFSYTNSSENDYEAETFFFGISQDIFGSMTNIGIGFGIGDDEIGKTGEPEFARKLDRQNYRISMTQILTKKLIMGINLETVTEEGYLQNPYRKTRIIFGSRDKFIDENYPGTKTSDAFSMRFRYHLPYRAALHGDFRYYSDSWGIKGRNLEIGYTHPLEDYPVILDFKYRFYSQNEADFFIEHIALNSSDEFDRTTSAEDAPVRFHGRDKELSSFDTVTYGIGAKWILPTQSLGFIEKASVSLHYDYIKFVYDDFRDADRDLVASNRYVLGEEPFFEFDANVIRFYMTAIY